MAAPRQLHHEGFEGWGHTAAGYVTDYVLFVVSAACLAYIVIRSRRPYDATQKLFTLFLVAQGVSFLSGGIAHHMLDIYASRGDVMGKEWSESNSGWMYPWILGVGLTPISSGAMVAMVFIFAKWPRWMAFLSLGLSLLAAGFEVAVFIRTELDFTGLASALRAVSASGVSLLVLFIGMVGRFAGLSKKASCWATEAGVGSRPLFAGALFACAAWGLVLGVPASCSKVGEARAACPFPKEFNHNAIFHILLMVATAALCWGVRLRMLSSLASCEPDVEEGKPPTVDQAQTAEAPKAVEVSKPEGDEDNTQPTLLGNEEATSPKLTKPAIVPEPGAAEEAKEDQAENTVESADQQPHEEQAVNTEPKKISEEGNLDIRVDPEEQVDQSVPKSGCVWCAA